MNEEEERAVERRVTALLGVAQELRVGVPLDDLHALLPTVVTLEEFESWLRAHPELARVEEGEVHATADTNRNDPERAERGRAYLDMARQFVGSAWEACLPLLRCIGVTGSSSYGQPEAGDDIDLLVVTRTGGMWLFLAFAYARLRWKGHPRLGRVPVTVCLNYVVEDAEAMRAFARPGGFLVARDALNARPIRGAEYYHDLLGSASWLDREAPMLYRRLRTLGGSETPARAPHLVRALNALLFPLLAGYLQASGLFRNHRLVREGRSDLAFRTETTYRRFQMVSATFERLSGRYRAAGAPVGGSAPRARAPVTESNGPILRETSPSARPR